MLYVFYKFWFKVMVVVVVLFGLIFFFGMMLEMFELVCLMFDLIFWLLDGVIIYDLLDMWFLFVFVGGFLFGWGVIIWCLFLWVYDFVLEGVRKFVLFGVLVWFIVDSIGLVILGNVVNVLFNIGFLFVVVGLFWCLV